jgi:hypothetical protein
MPYSSVLPPRPPRVLRDPPSRSAGSAGRVQPPRTLPATGRTHRHLTDAAWMLGAIVASAIVEAIIAKAIR